MSDVEVEVQSPLADLFRHCETKCVRVCCGIDAISTDAKQIGEWTSKAGGGAVDLALHQLGKILVVVEDRSHKVSSKFLNHYTVDETARAELLTFLGAFRCALQASR